MSLLEEESAQRERVRESHDQATKFNDLRLASAEMDSVFEKFGYLYNKQTDDLQGFDLSDPTEKALYNISANEEGYFPLTREEALQTLEPERVLGADYQVTTRADHGRRIDRIEAQAPALTVGTELANLYATADSNPLDDVSMIESGINAIINDIAGVRMRLADDYWGTTGLNQAKIDQHWERLRDRS